MNNSSDHSDCRIDFDASHDQGDSSSDDVQTVVTEAVAKSVSSENIESIVNDGIENAVHPQELLEIVRVFMWRILVMNPDYVMFSECCVIGHIARDSTAISMRENDVVNLFEYFVLSLDSDFVRISNFFKKQDAIYLSPRDNLPNRKLPNDTAESSESVDLSCILFVATMSAVIRNWKKRLADPSFVKKKDYLDKIRENFIEQLGNFLKSHCAKELEIVNREKLDKLIISSSEKRKKIGCETKCTTAQPHDCEGPNSGLSR